MNDRELDRMVARVSPISDERVALLELGAAEAELSDQVTATVRCGGTDIGTLRKRRLITRGGGAVAGLAAVAALLIALLVGNDATRPEFADAAVRVAEANSRLLLGEPGWSVERIAEFTADDGEISFVKGHERFEIHWVPAGTHREYLRDRASNATRSPVTVLGRRGVLFRYDALDIGDIATVLPPDGTSFVEIRGDVTSERRYRELLASLKHVDVQTWLAALPAFAVRPDERRQTVAEMLTGLPIPPGVRSELDHLRDDVTILDRYDLTAAVSGVVACGWLEHWATARAVDDAAAEREAVRAMSTARHWPLFSRLPDEQLAGYPAIVWGYADAMRDHRTAITDHRGVVDMTRQDWGSALGCRGVAGN
jgi:hypothetical protein